MIRIPKPFDSHTKREPLGCTGVRSVDLMCTQDGVSGGGTVTSAGAGFVRARGWNRGAVREAAHVKAGFVRAGWSNADRSGVGTLWLHGYACVQCGGVGVKLRILRALLCDSTMFAYRFVVKNARNAHSGFYFE